jgi:hypothetical protein
MTTDELLQQGIAALKAGQKVRARSLLEKVVQQDERHEIAWLWLSGAVDTDEERRRCLEKVLAINPNNSAARQGLDSISRRASTRPTGQPKPSQVVNLSTIPPRRPTVESVSLPKESFAPQTSPSPVAKTKLCPFCAEEIQESAIVCKHCGRELVPLAASPVAAPMPEPKPKKQKKWYMATGVKILTFLFFTPLWTLIVLDDPDSTTGVKVLASILLVFYLGICCLVLYSRMFAGGGG